MDAEYFFSNRRFCGGGGDADVTNIPRNIPNYFRLPLVGSWRYQLKFPLLHREIQEEFEQEIQVQQEKLRRKMRIPASELREIRVLYGSPMYMSTRFRPLRIKSEYARLHRRKQLEYQRRLDLLVKRLYKRKTRELRDVVKKSKILKKQYNLARILTTIGGFCFWVYLNS